LSNRQNINATFQKGECEMAEHCCQALEKCVCKLVDRIPPNLKRFCIYCIVQFSFAIKRDLYKRKKDILRTTVFFNGWQQ
jgi:hypothetical protein